MGCHTWFYKKTEVSIEEARKAVMEDFSEYIDRYTRLATNPTEEDLENLEDCVVSEEYLLKNAEILKRKLRMVEKGLCNVAVFNKYTLILPGAFQYMNGVGMFESTFDLPANVFTIKTSPGKGYPEDKLFSLEETLKFIEDNKDKICYPKAEQEAIKELKKFWKQYPDGMIDFG